jgi:6-phosphogluconolactonase
VDATAGFLLAAHYEEGGIELFPIDAAGRLGAALARPSTGLQAHSAVIAPDNTAVFVPNKGSNTISQLGFDAARGVLTPSTPPSIAASGGPRHLAFHPNHDVVYVINELGSTVRAYAYVREQGVLTEIDSDDSLPAGFSGSSSGADIHVEPTGKFVYASNRAGAESTLAIFAVDPTSGALAPVGHESTRGNTPRNFAIHPAGQLLLVANQDSNQLAAFRLDSGSGALTFVASTDVGDKAWCVKFLVVPDEG